MRQLVRELDDPGVAAAQGYYAADPDASLCARAMNLDLEQRYAAIAGDETSHVCTGNSAYTAAALHRVGLFDETFGYGYDNDISYRLQEAGYRLKFCRGARSVHRWREGLPGYLLQQYGFGYGRIDLVAKHPQRFGGDAVSPAGMMSHPLLMGLAILALVAAMLTHWRAPAIVAIGLIAVLALERAVAGISAARRFRDATALAFPLLHLARDAAWVAALAVWIARRFIGRPGQPSHSMRPRTAAAVPAPAMLPQAHTHGRGCVPLSEPCACSPPTTKARICRPSWPNCAAAVRISTCSSWTTDRRTRRRTCWSNWT
jgi:hypothetical protein